MTAPGHKFRKPFKKTSCAHGGIQLHRMPPLGECLAEPAQGARRLVEALLIGECCKLPLSLYDETAGPDM